MILGQLNRVGHGVPVLRFLGGEPRAVLELLAAAEGLGCVGVEEFFALESHDTWGRLVLVEFLGVRFAAWEDRQSIGLQYGLAARGLWCFLWSWCALQLGVLCLSASSCGSSGLPVVVVLPGMRVGVVVASSPRVILVCCGGLGCGEG